VSVMVPYICRNLVRTVFGLYYFVASSFVRFFLNQFYDLIVRLHNKYKQRTKLTNFKISTKKQTRIEI